MIRKFCLLFGLSLFLFSANAQVNVQVHMQQFLRNMKFVHDRTAEVDSAYFIRINRLQYYISGFKLIHDGGQITTVPDAYFLVSPSRDSILDLGEFQNVQDLEQLEFSVGVDSAHNHLDPAAWPAEHALAPKDPSMHWGWQGGYRFIAFEGEVGTSPDSIEDQFQIHGLDDSNYIPVLLNTNEVVEGNVMRIPVKADYALLLDGIDARGGLIKHGSQGIPRTLIYNLAYKVFSTEPTSLIVNPGVVNKFTIMPNPCQGELRIEMDVLEFEKFDLVIFDMNGKQRLAKRVLENVQQFLLNLEELANGIYIISIKNDERIVAFEKLIIQR